MTDEKNNDPLAGISPDVLAALTNNIMEQLASKDERERQARITARETEREKHDAYITKMKESKDPWVEVIGAVEDTAQGVRIALEWNDAFVQYLQSQGVNGTDEGQVVQHWVTLILRDMAEQMEESSDENSEYS